MDQRPTAAVNRQPFIDTTEFGLPNSADLGPGRLSLLIELNTQTANKKRLAKSAEEKLAAEIMRQPLNTKKAFAHFGLLLGTFPPAAIFTKFVMESPSFRNEESWIFGLLILMNLITAVAGYFSGKLVSKIIREVETYSWWLMLATLPFIGIIWGMIAGGAGGAIVLLFGALFGALIGGVVGAAAIPLFTVFHRILKRDEMIENRHFLPLAFGVTFTICAFIFGY